MPDKAPNFIAKLVKTIVLLVFAVFLIRLAVGWLLQIWWVILILAVVVVVVVIMWKHWHGSRGRW